MVCVLVLSVCLMVCHDREHCKMAEPIELSFGMLSGVSSGNDVFNVVQIPSCAGAILRGKTSSPL